MVGGFICASPLSLFSTGCVSSCKKLTPLHLLDVGSNTLAAAEEARSHALFCDASPQSYNKRLTRCRCGTTEREKWRQSKGLESLELKAPPVF